MRAFQLAYRLGGEEYLILLPGADPDQTMELAVRLCDAVAANRFTDGLEITVSCGVSASPAGEPFNYETLFEAADSAMYAAKREGQNSVNAAPDPDAELAPALV